MAVCDSGRSALAATERLPLDALFLDIQMPGIDGFGVVQAIQGSRPLIIFITAHGDFALQAFEAQVFDYVKKPIDPARFALVLDRIHQRLIEKQLMASQLGQAAADVDSKSTTTGSMPQDQKLLNAVRQDLVYRECEIQCIESASNYVNVRINAESYLVRESLEKFCSRLRSPDFVRVHRSHVVNVRWVRSMRNGKSGSAELDLDDGHVVPVSRSRRKKVSAVLKCLIDPTEIRDDDFII
jgi:two-component system LytT family response regulator